MRSACSSFDWWNKLLTVPFFLPINSYWTENIQIIDTIHEINIANVENLRAFLQSVRRLVDRQNYSLCPYKLCDLCPRRSHLLLRSQVYSGGKQDGRCPAKTATSHFPRALRVHFSSVSQTMSPTEIIQIND